MHPQSAPTPVHTPGGNGWAHEVSDGAAERGCSLTGTTVPGACYPGDSTRLSGSIRPAPARGTGRGPSGLYGTFGKWPQLPSVRRHPELIDPAPFEQARTLPLTKAFHAATLGRYWTPEAKSWQQLGQELSSLGTCPETACPGNTAPQFCLWVTGRTDGLCGTSHPEVLGSFCSTLPHCENGGSCSLSPIPYPNISLGS